MLEVSRREQSIDTSQLSALSSENYRGFVQNTLSQITSGEIARRFGHQYDQNGFHGLFVKMENNVKEVLPKPEYIDPDRQQALDEMIKRLHNLPTNGSSRSELEKPDLNPPVPSLKIFFNNQLLSLKMIPSGFSFFSNVEYETKTGQDANRDVFTYRSKIDNGKNRIYAQTHVVNPLLPVAQEEFFHAVQELCMGNVFHLQELDMRISEASKHVTHVSIVLDRVLSAAAAEMGRVEFSYWAKKADVVTQDFKDKFVGKMFSSWESTPLGKEVNKRFRYPISDPREVGALVACLALDLEKFLIDKNGGQIADNYSLFEIISIQFGNLQKELGFQMVDLVDTKVEKIEDYEKIGRKIIEWGKKVLKFYKGKKEENELVTHHTHFETKLDPTSFEFEPAKLMAKKINTSFCSIPTVHINFFNLAQIAREISGSKLKEFVDICFPENDSIFVQPPLNVLKKFDLDVKTVRSVLEKARQIRQIALDNLKISRVFKGRDIIFINHFTDINF